ncbi:peptidoglycan-binding protein [Streptomyces sp. VNUA74]
MSRWRELPAGLHPSVHQLIVNGVVDPPTWKALREADPK